jgi:hypothetical protein
VHKNPKYENVKGTINTGKTAKDVQSVSKFAYKKLQNCALI